MNNLNLKNYFKYSLLFIPLISVYIPTVVYPGSEDIGKNVPFRPPGYVFSIVWPILLILLGISWYKKRNLGILINLSYIILTLLLSLWLILYDLNKIFGLIDIIISLFITIFLFVFKIQDFKIIENLTLIPLIFWLIFASILNIFAINLE